MFDFTISGGMQTLIDGVGLLLGGGLMIYGAVLAIMGVSSYFEARANADSSKQNSSIGQFVGGVVLGVLGFIIQQNFGNIVTSVF
ncbi:MAG: hypothetical protein FWG65_05975 [Turicibacter sp.]|nr:hypothetical protein [Turicibacter sp.]